MVSEVVERPKRLKPEKININLDVEEPKVAQSTVYTLISTVLANKLSRPTIRVEKVTNEKLTHVRVKFNYLLPSMDLFYHMYSLPSM